MSGRLHPNERIPLEFRFMPFASSKAKGFISSSQDFNLFNLGGLVEITYGNLSMCLKYCQIRQLFFNK